MNKKALETMTLAELATYTNASSEELENPVIDTPSIETTATLIAPNDKTSSAQLQHSKEPINAKRRNNAKNKRKLYLGVITNYIEDRSFGFIRIYSMQQKKIESAEPEPQDVFLHISQWRSTVVPKRDDIVVFSIKRKDNKPRAVNIRQFEGTTESFEVY